MARQSTRERKQQAEQAKADAFIQQAASRITFDVFRSLASRPVKRQRPGQTAFNSLVAARPDIANTVRGRVGVDPFYDDGALPAFWRHVEANW